MNNSKDLLELLWERIGCTFLSDLKYKPHLKQVPYSIDDSEVENFPLKDFEEMVYYLYGQALVFSDYSEVIQYLNTLRNKRTVKARLQ